LQTAAYARAEFWVPDDDPDDEQPLPEVERIGVVHLTPEGTRVYDLGDPDKPSRPFRTSSTWPTYCRRWTTS
jgi:hypothetical protein